MGFLSPRVQRCRGSSGALFGGPKTWQERGFCCGFTVRRQKSPDFSAGRERRPRRSCLGGNFGKAFLEQDLWEENRGEKVEKRGSGPSYRVCRRLKIPGGFKSSPSSVIIAFTPGFSRPLESLIPNPCLSLSSAGPSTCPGTPRDFLVCFPTSLFQTLSLWDASQAGSAGPRVTPDYSSTSAGVFLGYQRSLSPSVRTFRAPRAKSSPQGGRIGISEGI